MSKYLDEVKKKLEEMGIGQQALQATINLYINPDNEQKLSEEIFGLKEEIERLSSENEEFREVTLELVSEVKKFLKELANMNFNSYNFKNDFRELQKRAEETYKILDLMEVLYE